MVRSASLPRVRPRNHYLDAVFNVRSGLRNPVKPAPWMDAHADCVDGERSGYAINQWEVKHGKTTPNK